MLSTFPSARLTVAFSNFGKAGGPFNFKAMNMEELDAKAKNLEKSKESKKKKLNPKVMIMIDQ